MENSRFTGHSLLSNLPRPAVSIWTALSKDTSTLEHKFLIRSNVSSNFQKYVARVRKWYRDSVENLASVKFCRLKICNFPRCVCCPELSPFLGKCSNSHATIVFRQRLCKMARRMHMIFQVFNSFRFVYLRRRKSLPEFFMSFKCFCNSLPAILQTAKLERKSI